MASPSYLERLYRYRWAFAGAVLALVLGGFAAGMKRVDTFTKQVDALADAPPAEPEPRVFDLRTDIWFDTKDPALRAYRELEEKFIGEDAIVIAFEDRQDPMGVFGVGALQTVHRLTRALEQVRYVRAVRSLTANPWIRWGAADGSGGERGLIVSDLFAKDPASYSEAERLERMIAVLGAANASKLVGPARVRAVLGAGARFEDHIGEPRLLGNVIAPDGRATALLVQVLRPRIAAETLARVFGTDAERQKIGVEIHVSVAQTEALAGVRKVLAQDQSGYRFRLAGGPVMQHHFQDTAKRDMSLMAVMFAVIGLLLLIIYRRVAGVALPLLVVLLAILGMMGAIFVKGDLINGLTAATPHMLIAIGIADAIHLVTAYYALRPQHTDKQALIIEVVRHNALPVLLTSLTTTVGFLSLTSSGIGPMRMFGYTAAIGTMIAYALSMTLVPAILSLLRLPASEGGAEPTRSRAAPHWSDRLTRFIMRRRAVIAAGALAVTAIAGFGLSRVQIHSDMRLMFPADDPRVADVYWLNDNIGGTGDLELMFDSAEPIAASASFLARLDAFQARLEKEAQDPASPLRILASFDSALGVLRKIHQVRNENKAAYYRVPVEADIPAAARQPRVLRDEVTDEEITIPAQTASTLIAQYYLQYESGAKPTDNLGAFITPDRKSLRVTIRTRSAPTHTTVAAYQRIRDIARAEFPELAQLMRLTGNYFMQMNMMVTFSHTMIESLAIALVVITLLMMIVFRSPVVALVSMIPNVLPIVVPLGVLALVGVPLDGPGILVAAVGLGVCVDDTIHFLNRYTRARRDGMTSEDAIRTTFREVGAALTYTTIVLVCGFAVMTLATFRPNAMIGVLGGSMIALAWVADFIVTPAVLSYLPARKRRER